jgi:pyruvate ferredoxin oxidoreductase delta subunit
VATTVEWKIGDGRRLNVIKRVEILYRGVFQKTLARRIGGDLVLIAKREGKVAFSNGRYSDAPERNGFPSKYFAFISSDLTEAELEAVCGGKLDIDEADVTVILDDTILHGMEPWAWHGIRPANEKSKVGGCLIVISSRDDAEVVRELEAKPYSYRMAVLDGEASLSGMWVFRDDLTHERVLGAIAAVDSAAASITAVTEHLATKPRAADRVAAARDAFAATLGRIRPVGPEDGIRWPHQAPELPGWTEFREGATVPAVPRRSVIGPGGQARNPDFQRGTSKTERPVVRFDLCTKCTMCWLLCPDGAFDPTDDGLYDVNYSYCSGCGKCADVCPVKDCIVMADELRFHENNSPWTAFRSDPDAYEKWAEAKKSGPARTRPHVSGRDEPAVTGR